MSTDTNAVPGSVEIDGVRWAYTERGTGPLVVLLHGMLSSAAMFDSVVDALADRYRCVALDWPGHGRSGYDRAGWTSDDLVEGVVRFIGVLGEPSAALVGLSQGGAVALRVALRHPEVVDALVTMNAGPDGPAAPTLAAMAELGRVLQSGTDAERRAVITRQQRLFHTEGWVDANPDAAQREVSVMLGHERDAMPLVTQVPASYVSIETQLPEISCPALILWGEQDVRAHWGPVMAAAMPVAQVATVPAAGHHLTLDASEATAREVGVFLDEALSAGVRPISAVDSPELLWAPNLASVEHSAIARFRDFLFRTRGLELLDYEQLWTWSVTDTEAFWAAVWDFFEIGGRDTGGDVLIGGPMPNYRWFPGAMVNFAGYLLSRGADTDQAILTVDEAGAVEGLDRRELRRQVGALAATLRAAGVRRGDIVAGYLPNTAHAVVAFAATATLGAVWALVGQDYAPSAAVSRLGQLNPVALITADGYRFNGRTHSRLAAVDEILAEVPTIAHTIIVDRLGQSSAREGHRLWEDAVAGSATVDPVAMDFSDPLWVLFSSGTTGVPKGLVHSHGGVLLEMLTMLGLHMDLGPGDRFFWYTSPSWMMWNVLAGALTTGASIVCYEGAPSHPDESAMWKLVADHDVTYFGTSPGFLQSCAAAKVRPGEHDLSALRGMGSTGSPLSADVHRWAREHLGDIVLNSSSGGTDVVGAFLLGAPDIPVWAGELSARSLGACVESWDETGRPVPTGQVGELVVTRPMPSMPLRFWNDPDGSRYRAAYFATYPGVWRHGDWITLTDRGSAVLHGRSDATLNRNGIRMGSGDIYAVVEAVPGVAEALVVGVERPDGSYWMPMFVVPRDGYTVGDEFRARVVYAIRKELSPRHLPDEIVEIAGIPHTKTGKKLEVPVKKVLLGADPAAVVARDAVDDPTLLDRFAGLRPADIVATP